MGQMKPHVLSILFPPLCGTHQGYGTKHALSELKETCKNKKGAARAHGIANCIEMQL